MSEQRLTAIDECADLRDIWRFSKGYLGNKKIDRLRAQAKDGIKVKFDISYYIQEHYDIKGNTVYLKDGPGTTINFPEFWDEVDQREAILRTALIEEELNEETTQAR